MATLFAIAIFCLLLAPRVARAQWCGCGVNCSHATCGCGCGVGGNSDPGPTLNGNSSFNSQNVTLHAWMPLSQIGGSGQIGSGIWGWTDSQTGHEYALYGISNGTSFIDITNPNAPIYLGQMATNTGNSIWRELQTYNDTLYVVSDGNGAHGMQAFDLTRLRGATSEQAWTPNSVYNGVTNVHTISINQTTGFAYLNGSNRGQHVVNLANPLAPAGVTDYSGFGGYVHDSRTIVYHGPDTAYTGREIVLDSNGGNGLEIVDFTNKNAPVRLSQRAYPNLGYTHQGQLTEDQRFFISNDEFDENNMQSDPNMRTRTHIWDLADLDNPVYLGYYLHDTRVIDHNLFIKGNLLYESNYTAGLRIFDIGALFTADLGALPLRADGTRDLNSVFTLAGFFDTYPQDDGAPEVSFNGQWGNYPFFPSGTIVMGDRNNGLFIVSAVVPEPATLALVLPAIAVSALAWRRRRG